MGFRGLHCHGCDQAELRGDPGSPRRTRWNGTRSRKDGFPGGRASQCQVADHWPFLQYDGLEQRLARRHLCTPGKSPRSLPALAGMPAPRTGGCPEARLRKVLRPFHWSRDPNLQALPVTLGIP
ncbi:hypothetical protein GWK47_001720 [Chionoecetes opilio]|uniref:Uncharacterized protein n=1 Tax=Chionoecetes opilio TaxID=41210 RepID=A0A8J4XTV4_CHIOP|nr:hypothetical protein GWK47_001720 [Chionoecetes opilio]